MLVFCFSSQSRNIRYTFKPKKGVGFVRYMSEFASDAVDLIAILCTYDPDHRVSAHRALKHSYFDIIKYFKTNTLFLFSIHFNLNNLVFKREMLANANKENEATRLSSPELDSVGGSGGSGGAGDRAERQSKLSSSEPNSVLDIHSSDLSTAIVSAELLKPILKRKVKN